jgi:hypothetical protein
VAKVAALKEQVCSHAPQPTAADVAGVATLVDERLKHMTQGVLARFTQDARALLGELQRESEVALKPLETRTRKSKFVPGMEQYLNAGLLYMAQELDPASRNTRLDKLRALERKGADAESRVRQVTGSLRAALQDGAALGAAAERYLDTLILFRQLYAQFPDGGLLARPEQLNQHNNLPLPPATRPLNLHSTNLAAFDAALALVADGAHMPLVRTSLSALLPTPLVDKDVQPAAGPADADGGDSLWAALAHQLFKKSFTGVNERNPQLLKRAVIARMLHHYGSAARAGRFLERHGISVQQYVAELAAGRRAAGLLELVFAAMVYDVQVCVWVSQSPPVALLVYHGAGPPRPRAYNLVLEDGASRFCSVIKLRKGGGGGITFSENDTVHKYELGEGERYGKRSVKEAGLSPKGGGDRSDADSKRRKEGSS